ncbi:polysaccharide deacetylase family protein [Nonomuraea jiangxiensis]|uniref:Peptidoglycan/xylan/chitin deacetylase, PgdA/CDA1 family n=1 Tax=Nonomuraea jiangxiensis TaxID=633440 RepID=A0A1G8ZQ27_9ACTN|nr:polysaccharide deacetylase family protein [Nonomuraea jiangxiensis]SDK16445.1 Peptidoglycan/xylan/chitin deacetylase, PgdA/CDA1 family [Nonomuraea jiangxiensis]
MRIWALPPLVLLVLTGCVTQPVPPDRPVAPFKPFVLDPRALARRLASIQPGWPRSRKFDCARVKCVALTFDDGPGRYTGKLLDLLRKRDVRATFFVVGQMVAEDRGGRITRRIADEGHELGNHSWSHPSLPGLSHEQLEHQLRRTESIVLRLTGIRMRMMRPPYGATDEKVAAEARREGLAQIMWNVDTLDWRDRVASVVAKRAGRATPGSIVLLHDIHASTVDAVPEILDTLGKKGFTFVTVSELYGRRPEPGRMYTER